MMNLIAKDCKLDKRIQIPENLNCRDVENTMTQKTFRTPKEHRETTFHMREMMSSSLKNNRAFGITICTKFWNQPGHKWLMQETPESIYDVCEGLHGIHAIAVVGYRCKNNKIQYLGQNSWGPNWKPENNHFAIKPFLILAFSISFGVQSSDFEIWRNREKHYLLAKDLQKQQLISKYCLEKKNLYMSAEALCRNKKYTLKNDVLKGGKKPWCGRL